MLLELARRDRGWKNDGKDLLASFTGLTWIYSDRSATFLKLNATVSDLFHVLWLHFTERKRRYLTDHEPVLLGFLPAESAELKDGNKPGCRREDTYAGVCIVRDGAPERFYSTDQMDGCAKPAHQNARPTRIISFETS